MTYLFKINFSFWFRKHKGKFLTTLNFWVIFVIKKIKENIVLLKTFYYRKKFVFIIMKAPVGVFYLDEK